MVKHLSSLQTALLFRTTAQSKSRDITVNVFSDGYDVAQTAICFLYQFVGHTANEIYGKDRKGKEISIKLACYREVDHFINLLRNRPDRCGTVIESIDFTDYKALPMDPVNCFEQEQTDYSKYDEFVGA